MSASTRIDSIKVEGRHRKDFGDIDGLAKSISDLGLLQPVVITPDLRLVAGERRIRAARSLGWETVPTRVAANLAEAADLLRAERDENTCRKDMNPIEEHSIYTALLELEKPKAKERQGERTDRAATSAKVSQKSEPPKRAKVEAAQPLSRSSRTLDKVGEVIKATETPETPEPVREVARAAVRDIESTGRVDGAYNRFKDAQKASEQPKPSPKVDAYLDDDATLADLEYAKNFTKALRSSLAVTQFDAERLSTLLDEGDVDLLSGHVKSLTKFLDTVSRSRRGLRLIEGQK